MITNATEQQLNEALSQINAKLYRGNVQFKEVKQTSKNRIQFTLRVFNSRMPGHRLAQSGLMGYGTIRRISSACWHVHGDFFEALFSIAPDVWVKGHGRTITIRQGNWVDWNIGSMMYPVMFSDACECEFSREPSYSELTARQIIRRKHGESRNFMTPRILGYGRLAPNVAYELSTGSGFLDPNPIYGVSVVAVFHRQPAKRLEEKSKCFAGPKARTAVRAYLDDLRAEFKGLSEYTGSFDRSDSVKKAQDGA